MWIGVYLFFSERLAFQSHLAGNFIEPCSSQIPACMIDIQGLHPGHHHADHFEPRFIHVDSGQVFNDHI